MSISNLAGAVSAPAATNALLPLAVLTLIAALALVLIAVTRDSRSRREAWARIAAARRSIQEWDRELRDREQRLQDQERLLLVAHDEH